MKIETPIQILTNDSNETIQIYKVENTEDIFAINANHATFKTCEVSAILDAIVKVCQPVENKYD